MTVAEFFAAAPDRAESTTGSDDWGVALAADLRQVVRQAAARAPRSQQVHLGPSEVGHPCDRQVAGKLAGVPATNHVSDPWPSIVGTAVHAWLADAFEQANVQQGWVRWFTERKVTPHPDHSGTADLYDVSLAALIDHKVLGRTTHDKVRRSGPSTVYLIQLLLYALGYELAGFPVRHIALAAWPRTGSNLTGLYVWHKTITAEDWLLVERVLLTDMPRRQRYATAIRAGHMTINQVPATPSQSDCYFCPMYRPQAAHDSGPGCPGPVGDSIR